MTMTALVPSLPSAATVPAELRARRQWVCWRPVQREAKVMKVPVDPKSGRNAAIDDPSTWANFEEALDVARRKRLGIGFVLTGRDPYVFVDLDHVVVDGEILPEAREIVDLLRSYTEFSPSGTGLHIFVRGRLPEDCRHRHDWLEVYDRARFATVTGVVFAGLSEIEDRQAELEELVRRYLTPRRTPAARGQESDDEELLARAFAAQNGEKLRRLWQGDWSEYPSQSEADLALCSLLAFWVGPDPARIDRLFRRSGLMRPKWDERHASDGTTYGELTIRAALAERTEFFRAPSSAVHLDAPLPWPEPRPLPPTHLIAPSLPDDLLPGCLRDWILDVAERSSTPLEAIACPALVALGTTVGRGLGIRPHFLDSFVVVPNLWGLDVDRPGALKTYRMWEGLAPLRHLAKRARARYEEQHLPVAAQQERLKAEIEAIKAGLHRASREGKRDEVQRLEARLCDLLAEAERVRAVERRYYTHDATIEKIAMLLVDNPRGLLVVRDELSGLLRSFEKPGREADREFYLEAWNGTGSYITDRVARGTLHVPALCLSVYGTIQPGKLRRYVREAVAGGSRDDGLLQRFQLLVWPETRTWAPVRRSPNEEAFRRVLQLFEALDRVDPRQLGARIPEEGIPYLTFDPEAQELADQWRDELEQRLRSAELARTPAFEAHLAKYRSLMPKLALLIDLVLRARWGNDGNFRDFASRPVSAAAVLYAMEWCAFLEQHARKVYEPELQRERIAAQALARRILDGAVADGAPVRDLYRPGWMYLRTPENVEEALRVLSDHGWVRIEATDPTQRGGRPGRIVRINPRVWASYERLKGNEVLTYCQN